MQNYSFNLITNHIDWWVQMLLRLQSISIFEIFFNERSISYLIFKADFY